eukprot:TRINITY_DN220_c2_g1_i2.p1 TRINITY_DN220_c2_g1~~TRINITY_DN220_c2_g1_i2.p1  ORF type:complete len:396 (+),score=176.82 TRINITY_DN220_c2_g1_i2:124-1311(+)
MKNLLLSCFILLFLSSITLTFSLQCSGFRSYHENTGIIEDHDTDGNYSSDTRCLWQIAPTRPGSIITLIFEKLDVAENGDISDILDIRTGSSYMSSSDFAWFSGNEIPPPIQIVTPSVFIAFYATHRIPFTGKGFRLKYSSSTCVNKCSGNGYCFNAICHCNPGWTGTDCSTAWCENNCGTDIGAGKCSTKKYCKCTEGYYGGDCLQSSCEALSYLTGEYGTFSDHHRDFTHDNYMHNKNCSWLIKPHNSETITLKFTAFETEKDYDVVRIYDGVSDTGNLIGSFSGNRIPPAITSSGDSLFITFSTDQGKSGDGFTAKWTSQKKASTGIPGGTVAVIAILFFALGIGLGVGGFILIKKYKKQSNLSKGEYAHVPADDQLYNLGEEDETQEQAKV